MRTMHAPASTRRFVTVCLATLIAVVFLYTSFSGRSHGGSGQGGGIGSVGLGRGKQQQQANLQVSQETLMGPAIAPKLGNETVKAELGRAAWKVFHTVFARFPDEPTEDESTALKSYVHLFQRLYPCGECAQHFGQILAKFPPQVSSRSAAAAWGCHVHNEVNKSLKKEVFDCSNIGDFYDCGCAED